jgi:hypothetical protein
MQLRDNSPLNSTSFKEAGWRLSPETKLSSGQVEYYTLSLRKAVNDGTKLRQDDGTKLRQDDGTKLRQDDGTKLRQDDDSEMAPA